MLVGASEVSIGFESTQAKYRVSARLGEANSDIISVTTSKDLTSPSGSFQIQLVSRLDSNKQTWFDKLSVLDFAEIRFRGIKDDDMKTVMRGLIDRIEMSEDYEGGVPRRLIVVTGRDLGCLLTDFQFYFIPALREQQQYAIKPGYGLIYYKAAEKGIEYAANIEDIYKFLIELWQCEVDFEVGQLGHILGYTKWDSAALYPQFRTTLQFIYEYYGAFWNAFAQFQDHPFHELFVYDDDNFSWFILRPSRYKDAKGNYHPRVKELLDRSHMYPNEDEFEIINEEKIRMSVTKDVANTYSYYITYPCSVVFGEKVDFWSVAVDPNINDLAKSRNPYLALKPEYPSYMKKFGFRPHEQETVYHINPSGQLDHDSHGPTRGRVFEDDVFGTSYIAQGIELNLTLVKWFLHNPLLLSGSIDIPGTNRALIGTYMKDMDEKPPMEYYVEGVNHTFIVLESFQTNLRLSRGMPQGGLGAGANEYFFI